MKITAIEPMTCDSGIGGRDWLFVKVTTDEGIVGWGEGYDWQASGRSPRPSGSSARSSSARTRGGSTSSAGACGTWARPAFRSG